ncbi:response regulator [Caballeronia sp. LZ033]|uniref:response regulator transcription factor n=1 Tax=Caballeronia sp. LZ033 TaxID=3038566 RepID=UPI0028679ACD|nr:response regulator [Caballeronia sp. LZ033]MDR5817308.1 response regulator [Caballeronia sp. LZ033]
MSTLVVVDDESLITDSLTFLLQDEGYTVHAAPNGKEALSLIARVRPALVVTDFMMPVMSGLELARALQKDGPAMPIILCSAVPHAIPPDEVHRFAALLRKPCAPADLIGAVARYVQVPRGATE